jgi:hypothetical protein
MGEFVDNRCHYRIADAAGLFYLCFQFVEHCHQFIDPCHNAFLLGNPFLPFEKEGLVQ